MVPVCTFSKFSVSHSLTLTGCGACKLCLQSQNLSYCLITAHDQEIKDLSRIRGNRLEFKFLQSHTKGEVTNWPTIRKAKSPVIKPSSIREEAKHKLSVSPIWACSRSF